MITFSKKQIGLAVLYTFLCALLAGSIVVGLINAVKAQSGVTQTVATTATQCSLQESKPVLIVAINGLGAGDLCAKIIHMSNNRYFAYYGAPPFNYTPICSVTVKKSLQYTVYDTVPPGTDPKVRYSYTAICSQLETHHSLKGQGF